MYPQSNAVADYLDALDLARKECRSAAEQENHRAELKKLWNRLSEAEKAWLERQD